MGILITVAMEEAASPSFAKDEIMRPIPIEVSEPKKIKAIIKGMFQKRETWKIANPEISMTKADK